MGKESTKKHNFNDKLWAVKMRGAMTSLLDTRYQVEKQGFDVLVTTPANKYGGPNKLTARIKDNGDVVLSVDSPFESVIIEPRTIKRFNTDVERIAMLVRRGANVVRIKQESSYFEKLASLLRVSRISITASTVYPQLYVSVQDGWPKRVAATLNKNGYTLANTNCSLSYYARFHLQQALNILVEDDVII